MIKPEEVFVTGYKGRLGSCLVGKFGCQPFDADITKQREVQDVLNTHPEVKVIINCAAKTGVDAAQETVNYKDFANVNLSGIGNFRLMLPPSIQVVHISTDYVFSGKNGPYTEGSPYGEAVNDYGWTKQGGEVAFQTFREDRDVIIRTTGLFGRSPDLVSRVVQELEAGNEIMMTRELEGNQTYIPYLCEGIIKTIKLNNPPPILHVASGRVISRYEFGQMIADVWRLDKKLIKPCWNKDIVSWIAPRPSKGGLDTSLATSLDIPIYDDIWSGLVDYKREIGNA